MRKYFTIHTGVCVFLVAALIGLFVLGGIDPFNDRALAGSSESNRSRPTLVVSGSGTTSVSPDQAKVVLAIVSNDQLLTTAQNENTQTTRKVIEALMAAGVPTGDVETSNFAVWPQYSNPDKNGSNKPPTIVGYQVRCELTVTVKNLPQLGKILDTALKAGANEIITITYEKADTSKATEKALAIACRDAMSKARAIAGALGMRLGPIVQINEGGAEDGSPRPLSSGFKSIGAGDIPVQPGNLEIRSDVTITFEIK